MDNETNGPKAQLAAGRAGFRFAILASAGFGALLGANNSFAATLLILGAVAVWVIVAGYIGIRKGTAEDMHDAEYTRGGVEPSQFCGDPTCVACSIGRALAEQGYTQARVVSLNSAAGSAATKSRGMVH